jgi:hypothetical protein
MGLKDAPKESLRENHPAKSGDKFLYNLLSGGEKYMQKMVLILLLTLCFLLTACKEKQQAETEEMQRAAGETSAAGSVMPQLSDDYYVAIYEAQELIKIYQDDRSYRQDYCQKAYLKDQKMFVSMGIARLTNPQTGQPLSRQMVERAANLDARRWASYGEMWLKDNYDPPFGQLNSYFNRPVTPLHESVVGDSLFVFIATSLDLGN